MNIITNLSKATIQIGYNYKVINILNDLFENPTKLQGTISIPANGSILAFEQPIYWNIQGNAINVDNGSDYDLVIVVPYVAQ